MWKIINKLLGKWEPLLSKIARAWWTVSWFVYNWEITGAISQLTGLSDQVNDHPYIAWTVWTTCSMLLCNLLWRWAYKLWEYGIDQIKKKRNIISRTGTVTPTLWSPITGDKRQDIAVEKDILNTKLRNIEDAYNNITIIIDKVHNIESDLKASETNINNHINNNDEKSTNEIHSHYAGDDVMTDIQEDGSLTPQDHYLTTKDWAVLLAWSKNKKDIIENVLPKTLYKYDTGSRSFASDWKYYIWNTEIQWRITKLEQLQKLLEQEKTTLSNRARATNTSLITINQINKQLNTWWRTNILLQKILDQIQSLWLSEIKEKKRPPQLTLTEETKILRENIENTEETAKSYLDKIKNFF
jgi:hypothetical protein